MIGSILNILFLEFENFWRKGDFMYCVSGNFLLFIYLSENLNCYKKSPHLVAEVCDSKDQTINVLLLPDKEEAEKFVAIYAKSLNLKITKKVDCADGNFHLVLEGNSKGVWIQYQMSVCKIDFPPAPAEKWQEVIEIAGKYIENGFR